MHLKWYVWLFSITAFLFTLYLVEFGPWSASQVGKYNNGYGTFDMKKYDTTEVSRVLSTMTPEGFTKSYRYYISDTIFVFSFGFIQVLLSLAIYYKSRNSKLWLVLGILAVAVPILRGLFDLSENGLLVYTLKCYPAINPKLVTLASVITQCKLMCIRIWGLFIGIGLLTNIMKH